MCSQCNYTNILQTSNLEPTTNRLRILEIIGNNGYPLTATDIVNTVARSHQINRVTVYRILDLLVENGIIEKLHTGGRAAYFDMAPNENHAPHPHFYCTRCGQMDCLTPESMEVDYGHLEKNFPGEIDRIEVRVDGICKNCLRQKQN